MKPYEEGKGNPPQTREMMNNKIYEAKTKIDKNYKPLLRARNIKRYNLTWRGDWIKYGANLAAPREPIIFNHPRILIQRIISGKHLEGTYVTEEYICNTDVITLKPNPQQKEPPDIHFFLGIILSQPTAVYLKSQNINLDRAAFPKINANTLENFPIPKINFSNPTDKVRHDKMVSLVEQMLEMNRKLASTKLAHEKTALERQIAATDKQIDALVYELYGLTEEEIKIVEGG